MGDIDWKAAETEIGKKERHVKQMLGVWLSANENMLADASVLNYPPRISLSVAAKATDGRRSEVVEPMDSIPIRAATMSAEECEVAGTLAADIADTLGLRVFREADGHSVCRYTFKPVYREKR